MAKDKYLYKEMSFRPEEGAQRWSSGGKRRESFSDGLQLESTDQQLDKPEEKVSGLVPPNRGVLLNLSPEQPTLSTPSLSDPGIHSNTKNSVRDESDTALRKPVHRLRHSLSQK
ncbi:hypothetical protein MHYP_G00307560 [Metynnis hypsauchen]